jgi:hypothetical protein
LSKLAFFNETGLTAGVRCAGNNPLPDNRERHEERRDSPCRAVVAPLDIYPASRTEVELDESSQMSAIEKRQRDERRAAPTMGASDATANGWVNDG